MPRKLLIVDISGESTAKQNVQVEKLSDDFGRNLDTIAKARKWLTNPYNWHDGNIFIIKWDGLLCTVSRAHGQRLVDEPWDNGLPEVVVREQIRIRQGGKQEKDDIGAEE